MDDGRTGLLGPGRVLKSSARVEAYGSVDELNATLGMARALDQHGWLAEELVELQRQLFELGAELATIASGAVQMAIVPFIVASVLSRGARFLMVALVAAKFGPPVLAVIEKRLTLFTIVFVVLLVGGFVLVRYL